MPRYTFDDWLKPELIRDRYGLEASINNLLDQLVIRERLTRLQAMLHWAPVANCQALYEYLLLQITRLAVGFWASQEEFDCSALWAGAHGGCIEIRRHRINLDNADVWDMSFHVVSVDPFLFRRACRIGENAQAEFNLVARHNENLLIINDQNDQSVVNTLQDTTAATAEETPGPTNIWDRLLQE